MVGNQSPPSSALQVFGTIEPPMKEEFHSFGAFQVGVSGGQITTIKSGTSEIARGLTYLVRDQNWATCGHEATVTRGDEKLVVAGHILENDIDFTFRLEIAYDGENHLIVRSSGTAHSTFQANRIGLTILHPAPEVVGLPLKVSHTDGTRSDARFPRAIQPAQPVFDIGALSYALNEAQDVELRFEAVKPDGGTDCFEMEDQRNWGDASYKTYIGSLLAPWPYIVSSGDAFDQTIHIRVIPGSRPAQVKSDQPAHRPAFRLPKIGASIPRSGAREALENLTATGAPSVSFVSAYLKDIALDYGELAAIGAIVKKLDCPLRVELEVWDSSPLAIQSVAWRMDELGITVDQILACPAPYLNSYQPNGDWPDVGSLEDFYENVRRAFPGAEIGGGMLTYFTELNRKWPPLVRIDFVGHGFCPIVHASDDRTVLQNCLTLTQIADTVADRAEGLAYDVISAQLSMRSNPYGAAPVANPTLTRCPMAAEDPREAGQFAALWMLCVAAQLGQTHARSVCFGALSGPASIYSVNAGTRPTFSSLSTLACLEDSTKAQFDVEVEKLIATDFACGWKVLGPDIKEMRLLESMK